MFRSLTIKEFDITGYDNVEAEEIANFKKKKMAHLSNLKSSLFNNDSPLNIDLITQHLCADLQPDIFLSQAHADAEQVIQLATLLERQLNLNVWVDASLWDSDDQVENPSSSISIQLNTALQQIIEHCELVIFLEKDNKDSSASEQYPELQFIHQVQRVTPDRLFTLLKSYQHNDVHLNEDKTATQHTEFSYTIQDHDLIMSNREFEEWLKFSAQKDLKFNPLDLLYSINVDVVEQ